MYDPYTPYGKRLNFNKDSNILLYTNGHGGDEFTKMQMTEVLHHYDLQKSFEELYNKNKFNEMVSILDSCEAATVYKNLSTPNVFGIGSSVKDFNSLAGDLDTYNSVSLNDKFT